MDMTIQKAREYYHQDIITRMDLARDPLTAGAWLICLSGKKGDYWTVKTARGVVKSYSNADSAIRDLERICDSVDNLIVSL